MPRVKKLDLGMTALDELFMNDKERAENKLPKIFDIPLSEIDDFPDHPYRVLDDEDMQNLMESIRDRGVITPAIKLLKGFNDLATTHPTIAEEWSEHNFPLSPDQVNAKSTKNVWWKCKACGNEWKSVISARVKGTSCPVCAERQVLRGHNDLATTDYMLCKEWDYEKNKVSPTEISRNSHSRVWWLCRYGHSWNAKICERTHEDKTCSVCESEFDSLLVQLLVSLYAKQYNMRVVTFDDNIIGLPVETYIPDMFSVIERINKRSGNENERAVKEHLCKMNGISYYEVSANNHYELADKIKKIFQKKNIYILSNSQEDIEKCKKAFFKWKDITQQ